MKLIPRTAAMAAAWCLALSASAFPDRPVTLVVPFPAGGATDTMARLAAERLSKQLGQPVVVENKAGAGGSIAAEAVLAAPRDGHTLFFATTGTLAINQHIYKRLRYDPLKDFVAVGNLVAASNVLVVHPSVKANSVAELIALAKAHPGSLTYASSGVGSSSHLSAALFAHINQIELVHVPYKGSAPALTDVLSGRVDMMFDTASTYAPYVKAGKVRALALTSSHKSPAFPNLPSIAEAGVKGYDVTIWFGIVAPAGVPQAAIDRLASALRTAWEAPDVRFALESAGAEPMYMAPGPYATFIRSEAQSWGATVKAAGGAQALD
jgi:tripartite-type tricarboxylate transporter receptor subunit TctC